MDSQEKLIRTLNYFNFDSTFIEDEKKDTDNVLLKAIARVCNNYGTKIKNNYSFIINYNNDIYSFLSYIIITICKTTMSTNNNIYLMGNLTTEAEKKFFYGVKTISEKKAKRMKKNILVTGFHPICNVINLKYFYKNFIDVVSPISQFSPINLEIAEDYYINDNLKEALYKNKDEDISLWKTFFSYPLSSKEVPKKGICIDTKIPICIFKLKDRNNFDLFDFILKSDKENNIHLYDMSECSIEDIEYFKFNLNFYLETKNHINDITIIDDLSSKIKGAMVFSDNNFLK